MSPELAFEVSRAAPPIRSPEKRGPLSHTAFFVIIDYANDHYYPISLTEKTVMKKLVIKVDKEELNSVPLQELVRRGWKLEIQEKDTGNDVYIEVTAVLAFSEAIKEEVEELVMNVDSSWEDA